MKKIYLKTGNKIVMSCITILFLMMSIHIKATVVFPLQVSNQHYLVDQNNTPFLIKEMSAWGLIQALSEADASAFMDSIIAKGFNTVLVNIINDDGSTVGTPHLWNGISPFTTQWDFSTPNEAYFAHVDNVLTMARNKGLLVLLLPSYLGFDTSQGWQDELLSATNSPAKSLAYGQFLGNRYKNTTNIIWVAGGDNSALGSLQVHMTNIIQGIKQSEVGGITHLWTAHWNSGTWSTDDSPYVSSIDLNGLYDFLESDLGASGPQYKTELSKYNTGKVIFQLDQSYEQDQPGAVDNTNYQWIRRKNYDGLLSGCAGTSFSAGISPSSQLWHLFNWRIYMSTRGMHEIKYCFDLFGSRPWNDLIPDQNTTNIITSGRGTFGDIGFACVARTSTGGTIIAYVPTSRILTVNMTQVSGTQARAWWYDPQTGLSSLIGTFSTTGTQNFTSTGADQILVLDDASLNLPAPGNSIAVTGVNVSPTIDTINLSISNTQQLTANVLPSNATNKSVSWSSSNTSVATVNPSGLVTAFTPGVTTITVTTADQGKTASSSITVSGSPIVVTGVTVSPTSAALTAASTQQLIAIVLPTNAANQNVSWSTSNAAVATVSTSGLVTAVSAGTATITATTVDQGKTATSVITVSPATNITIGETNILTGDDSGNGNLLEVQQVTLGQTATIQSLSFYVTNASGDLRLGIYDATGPSGGAGALKAQTAGFTPVTGWNTQNVITPAQLTAGTYWLAFVPSSDLLGMKVQTTGNAQEFSFTYAALPATYSTSPGNFSAHWSFYATLSTDSSIPVTGVTVSPTSATLTTAGATQQLTATVLPTNATNKSVSWSTSNAAVATVSTNGLVTAVANGTATITVTTVDQGKTATSSITVNIPPVVVTGVTVSPTSATLTTAGATQQLTATVLPTNATNKSVSWSTSNAAVATVSTSGLVTAVANGTATITVTTVDQGKAATSSITVNIPPIVVTGVSVSPTSTTLTTAGATQQLTTTVLPTNATNKSVSWSTSNAAVATVSSSGLVTAVANGTATITVTTVDQGKTATSALTVSITANITIGETNILTGDDSGNGNLLEVQQVTLGQTATVQSLSFYVTNPSGNLRLGIYDATGPSGGAGALKAQTAGFTPVTGWNTQNVITPAQLTAGTYWLAFLPSSDLLGMKVQTTGNAQEFSFTFAALPATYSTSPDNFSAHWSFYATLSTGMSLASAIISPVGDVLTDTGATRQPTSTSKEVPVANKASNQIMIYPNPMSASNLKLNVIGLGEGNLDVTVVDIRGRVVYQNHLKVSGTNAEFPLENMSQGLYFIKVVNNNQVLNQKLVVR